MPQLNQTTIIKLLNAVAGQMKKLWTGHIICPTAKNYSFKIH